MGLFGGGSKTPQININVPKLPTAEEIFQQSLQFGQQNFPNSLGARESALGDLATPQSTQQFFGGFQPTSFEDALSNQFFQNTIRDVERSIKQNLSLSGTASSPILAEQIARARGELGVGIGSKLLDVSNARGLTSLQGRLGVDPNSVLNPFVQTQIGQSNAQANFDFQKQLVEAQNNLQRQIEEQRSRSSGISTIGSVLGAGAGFLLGGPVGAGFGASLGGSAASLFGGGESPVSLGDAFSLQQLIEGLGVGGGGGSRNVGKPTPVNTPNIAGPISQFPSFEKFNSRSNQLPFGF